MSTERVRVIQSGQRSQMPLVPDGAERRGSARIATRTPGQIYVEGAFTSTPCMITDISGTGARLELQPGRMSPFRGASSIGQRFKLVMRVDRLEVFCEIVHCNDTAMGVKFISPAQPVPRKV